MKSLKTILTVFFLALFLSFTPEGKTIIIIDVGHGGDDNGVITKESVLEKDITLKIAQKIQEANNNPGIEIKLTRNSDEILSIEDRVNYINNINPSYVISIHANFNRDSEIQGVELYYNQLNSYAEASKELTKKIKSGLEQELKINKMTQANFSVLLDSNCPAVMIETGFLSNSQDLAFLTSEEGQKKIANQILLSLNL